MCADSQTMSEQERIIALLEEISKDLKKVLSSQEAMCLSPMDDPKNWANTRETMKITEVSVRTLYNIRLSGDVRTTRIGNQYHYYIPDLYKIRNRYVK